MKVRQIRQTEGTVRMIEPSVFFMREFARGREGGVHVVFVGRLLLCNAARVCSVGGRPRWPCYEILPTNVTGILRLEGGEKGLHSGE